MEQEINERPKAVETTGKHNDREGSLVEEQLQVRVLRKIIMKRQDTIIFAGDPGHWWVEIYKSEEYSTDNLVASYGWYPFVDKDGDGIQDCEEPLADDGICYKSVRPAIRDGLSGVEGRLNRGFKFDPQATKTRISWSVDDMFHPMVDDGRSDEEVANCIKKEAEKHKGEWAWPATASNEAHCRTFQLMLMSKCRLMRAPEQVRHMITLRSEEGKDPIQEKRP